MRLIFASSCFVCYTNISNFEGLLLLHSSMFSSLSGLLFTSDNFTDTETGNILAQRYDFLYLQRWPIVDIHRWPNRMNTIGQRWSNLYILFLKLHYNVKYKRTDALSLWHQQ